MPETSVSTIGYDPPLFTTPPSSPSGWIRAGPSNVKRRFQYLLYQYQQGCGEGGGAWTGKGISAVENPILQKPEFLSDREWKNASLLYH